MPSNHHIPHTEEAKAKMRAARLGKPAKWKLREMLIIDGEIHYRCGCCRCFLPREKFYRSKRNSLGITSECKRCHCLVSIRSRDPERARTNNRKYMTIARILHPEIFRKRDRERSADRQSTPQHMARLALNAAIRTGKIRRPGRCSDCGGIGKIHGHHKDYQKPLDVEWLCSTCHGKRHRKV